MQPPSQSPSSPPSVARVVRALARRGLTVRRDGPVWCIRHTDDPHAPFAEVLLPDALPLEADAAAQLADLASVRHPHGGGACAVCATPDFHPGDSGIAIGSVFGSDSVVVPAAVGSDVNCGMRLHATDLELGAFESGRASLVDKLRGDYLLGTRDSVMSAASMRALFSGGLPAWIEATRARPLGRCADVDWAQVWDETTRRTLDDGTLGATELHPRVFGGGSLAGDVQWAPQTLVPDDGEVRDDGLATIGRGNHFVEVQVVDEVMDRRRAWAWGLARDRVVFMVHTGSRKVGKVIGATWRDRAREAWPDGERYPASRIFPLPAGGAAARAYLSAEATAGNYGFVNRMLLAELMRLRLREVFGAGVAAPLVYDVPHNLTTFEGGLWVSRKGACPAHAGLPVIIPGSMGTASFVCVGRGARRFLQSASHGAGRAVSRGAMGQQVRDDAHATALGLDGVHCVTLRDERRVQEAPAAYKPIEPVVAAQRDAGVVEVVARLRPLLTFKA
ncbi:MAG: RtcB family protein [Myxococcota bacterium]